MIRWIVRQSLKFRFLLVVIAAVLIFFGFDSDRLEELQVDVLPEFSRPYVEVQTEALGLSAAEVESLITVPLEADMLNGVAWVDEIRSESIPGLSSIVLIFQPGTDILRARQAVQEHLVGVHALPNVSKPPTMLQPVSSTNRVMMIGLSSKELSLIETSVLARWNIKPRLMGVSGVANVAIWGQRERQLQVQVDPGQLREKGVSLQQIINTAGNSLWVSPLSYLNASTPGTGGFIDTPNQRLGIRHLQPISTPEELAQVTVEGTEMRLGDVAQVVEDHQPLIGDSLVKDTPSLMLVVEKFPWASTLEVTEEVEEALDGLRPGLSGLEIDSSLFRPATYIQKAIDNLAMVSLIGAVLVIVALFVCLYDWRTALISCAAILMSLLVAGFVFYLRGTPYNMMVLAGLVIALGIIIDDAVVYVQNIRQRLGQKRAEDSGKSAGAIILAAMIEMRRIVYYATPIILMAVAPIFFMKGQSGAFFQPLAISYAWAVLASMLVALTLTPALCRILLPNEPRDHEPPLLRGLQRGCDAMLSRILQRPAPLLVSVCAILAAGLLVLPGLGQESLLPAFKETNLLVEMEGAPGTSRPEMNRIVTQMSRELRSIPGVRNVSAQIGRAIMSDEVANVNSSALWVSIDPSADYDQTVAKIEEVSDGYTGFDRDVQTYLKERVQEELTGADDAIVVRVYGEDTATLRGLAEEVKQKLGKIEGLVDLQVEHHSEESSVEIEVDLEKAKPYGLKPGDVRRAAATLLSGIQVGNLFEDQKVFDVVVWGNAKTRQSVSSIRDLLIDTPSGGQVRLEDVADVRIVASPSVIEREAVSRYIDVGANVSGRDLGGIASDVKKALKKVAFPTEYRAELLGESVVRQAAQKQVVTFVLSAAIGIFLLLQAAFGSWGLASLMLLILPLALTGGVLAAFISGGVVSLGSLLGFLAVLAIAARNCILMIHHYRHLEQHDGEVFGLGLVLRGTRERLAPILTTALTTGLALMPFVVYGDIAGLEVVHPMSVIILGGLVTSTVFSLFCVPAVYLLFGAKREPDLGLSPALVTKGA
jgi:CzcA family heavy metal efflux pump